MRTIYIFLFILIFTFHGWSQSWPDGHTDGVSPTCNGGSDGYVELDMYYVFFYSCGYYGLGWGNFPARLY